MKKFIAIILSATTIFTCSTSVFADDTRTIEITQSMEIKNAKKNTITSPQDLSTDNSQKLFVNDQQVEIKDGSVVYENRLFLPVRELGQALGLEVGYVEKEKIVALDNGKIQLPVNQNKAVVDGNIVSIDKENDKVGTIVLNDKTYLPIRFVSESLGYKVEYVSDKKEVYINTNTTVTTDTNTQTQSSNTTQLDKNQAVEEYKKLSEANENVKNATVDTNAEMNFSMSDGTESLNMKMDMVGTIKMDISDKVNMYSEQKSTIELLGQQEVIEQTAFYKDGQFYVNQGGIKYKMPVDLEEAIDLSSTLNVDDFINEDVVLGGSVKNLDNNNKEYTFDIDLNKSLDMASQIVESLNLGEQDKQTLEGLKVTNTKIAMAVDDKNQPVGATISFDMELTVEGINLKGNISMDMDYKDIDKTVVNIPNEDLNSYVDFEELLTTETTTQQ